jgi:NAD-dependent DNA ligase
MPETELMKALRSKKGGPVIKYVVNHVSDFEGLIPSVLGNKAKYSAQVVSAFEKHKGVKTPSPTTNELEVTIQGRQTVVSHMVVAFTGTLGNMTRDTAQRKIKRYGAQVASSISYKVTHVVAGSKTGAKVDKAKKLKIPIMTEAEFMQMLRDLNTTRSTLKV